MPGRNLVAAAALVALLLTADAASAATCNSTADGAWNVASNWSCNAVPGAGDAVTIDETIALDATRTVGSLSLVSSGHLTLSGGRTLTTGTMAVGQGAVSGDGRVMVNSTFSKPVNGSLGVRDSAELELNGDGSIAQGTVCLQNTGGGAPRMTVNATLTLADGNPAAGGDIFDCNPPAAPVLRIASTGTLVDQHAGLTKIHSTVDNDGTIRADAGVLALHGGSGTSTSLGTYEAMNGDELELRGTTSLASGLLTESRLTGAGTIDVAGSTLAGTGVDIDPGTLSVSGSLRIEGPGTYAPDVLQLAGGSVDSARDGTTTLLHVLDGVLRGEHTLTPAAFIKTTGGQLTMRDGAILPINADSTWHDGPLCMLNSGGPAPQLQINATLTLAAGNTAPGGHIFNCTSGPGDPWVRISSSGVLIDRIAGDSHFFSTIENDGVIRAEAGLMNLAEGTGGATSNGTYHATAGHTLRIDGTTPLGAGGAITGAGTVDVRGPVSAAPGTTVNPGTLLATSGGTLTVQGTGTYAPATIVLDGGTIDSVRNTSPGLLDARHGVLRGAHTTTAAQLAKTTGGELGIRDGANLVVTGSSVLTGGLVCLRDGGHLRARAQVVVPAGTMFDCATSGTAAVVLEPGGSLGMIGGGTRVFSVPVNVAGGALAIGATQKVQTPISTLTAGGSLSGLGELVGSVTNISGVVRPGSSPGAIDITGNYIQGEDGTLAIEIAGNFPGSEYDRLIVGGSAGLNGTLAISRPGGFDPADTDEFRFLIAGSRIGEFATLTGAALPGNRVFTDVYDATRASLHVADAPPPPPPPPPPPDEPDPPAPPAGDDEPAPPATTTTTPVTPSGTPAPTARPSTSAPTRQETALAAASSSRVATALGLPAARRCQSRRRFTIRLRQPAGVRLASAVVRVNGKRVRVRRVGGRLTPRVDLRGLRRGRFTVTIRATTVAGTVLDARRAYRTCGPKRR